MFEPGLLITYIAACFVFSIVPGPSVTMVLANSLARGTAAGFWTILGTELSMFSMVLVVAFGLEAVMALVGEAFVWIKLVGAAYLIWIGWRMFNSSGELGAAKATNQRGPLRYVVEAALVNWSNPKTLLFLGAFLPQFVNLAHPAFDQIIVLGLIVMAVATLTDAFYAILAGRARHALDAARVRLMSRFAGVILMAGGVWLALQKRS
ncbi:MAG: LysE family translocator [Alphaproteobacteria bacterium]|nr:LysE family translocator [Alphaproteobacteria bacterium]